MNTVDKKIQKIIETEKEIEESTIDCAILFTDLVGSTKFKAVNGLTDGLKRTLVHNSIVSNSIANKNGKVIKFIGDGVMANFDDVNDAINCSININKEFSELGLPEPILSKTGIHWGPVSFFKYPQSKILDPQGTTVDIAAKIVGTAKGRQVLISKKAFEVSNMSWEVGEEAEFIPKGFNEIFQIISIAFEGSENHIEKTGYISYLDKPTQMILESAQDSLKEQDWAQALKLSSQVLGFDSRNPKASFIYGTAMAAGGFLEIDNAIIALNTLLNNNPKHYRAMHLLSFLLWKKYEEQNDIELIKCAAMHAKTCLKLCADDHNNFFNTLVKSNLAYYLSILEGTSNLKEAESLWHEVEKYYSKSMSIHNAKFADTYGVVLHKLGRFEESREKFNQAISWDPNNEYPHLHLFQLIKNEKKLPISDGDW